MFILSLFFTANSKQLTQHAPHTAAAQPLDCGDVNHEGAEAGGVGKQGDELLCLRREGSFGAWLKKEEVVNAARRCKHSHR
jgi:hypothetical protein